MFSKHQNFVNGQWLSAQSGLTYPVINPANSETLAHIPDCSSADAQKAVESASQALPSYQTLTGKQRSKLLRNWFDLIIQHQDELAKIMTLESGKPLAESKGEVKYGASFAEWFAEEAKRIYGDVIAPPTTDRKIIVIKRPVGVCTAITPWNFPLAMITRKCSPALAAGCTVVVKPAESTPLTALALAELAEIAGFPAGVFNVITASSGVEVGNVLSTHPLVRKISFTGSTAVGKLLIKQTASTVKRVSMELGGNAPFIVFDDADLDKAVDGAVAAKYRNTGQTCVCANRFLIHKDIAEAFSQALAKRVAQLTVGDGLKNGVQQGPLINLAAFEKVSALVDDAIAKGATALTGGKPHQLGGNFYEPTVLSGVHSGMRMAQEEIFGPVAPIYTFVDEAEAIAMANDTPYGLAAYCYTNNMARTWRLGDALEYGMIGFNEGIISTELAPFGGVKESGIGREGSKYGIDEYLDIKYLCLGGLS